MGLILLSVVIVTLAAVGVSLLQKSAYQGVAQVVVTQQNTGLVILGTAQPNVSYQPGRDEVQTQVEVLQSPQIAERVIQTLQLNTTASSLLGHVAASADTGTNVITIQAIDSSPTRAAGIANAFAEEYIAWSRDSQRQSINAAAADVERRLADAQEQMVAIEATARGATVADQVRLEVARGLYTRLADQLEELRIAEQLSTGKASLLATATASSTPVSPKPRRNAMLGISIGLLLGLGVAFLAEQLDTRVKSAQEVSGICGAPVLATIPTLKVRKSQPLELALAHRPDSPDAEAYRMLRNSLDFINIDKTIKSVLVTSAVPSEGKSTVAANLATVLSQAGSKVMLVVCDFRLPAIERLFELEGQVGLSDVLAGASDLRSAAQRPKGFDNLWVLSAGSMPPNPSELLGSAAMGRLMADLRESVDWVILDSAPILATADAAAVSRWTDGALMVARVGTSKRDAIHSGCEQLANVGAVILGVAVLGPMDGVTAYGYYGYADHATR